MAGQIFEAALQRFGKPGEESEVLELRKKVRDLERVLGQKSLEVEIAKKCIAGLGVRERAARARALAADYPKAVVARVMQVSRQSLYKQPPKPPLHRPPKLDATDQAIVDVARKHPHDGYRMVAAITARVLDAAVNAKRALRVMRQEDLLQRRCSEGRRRRPGRFIVERPDELWQLDMTAVWTVEHGWCYLMAIIDCFTRELVSWVLEPRCRTKEAIEVVAQAIYERNVIPGTLTLGTDNGTSFTSHGFVTYLKDVEVNHRLAPRRLRDAEGTGRESAGPA